MTNTEEHDQLSSSPDGERPLESDEFDLSSLASLSTAASQASLELHRHNTQLLRQKQDMEMKHNDEILALRRRIVELEDQVSQLRDHQRLLIDEKEAICAENARNQTDWNEYRANLQRAHESLFAELAGTKETLIGLQEENKSKDSQLNDLKDKFDKAIADFSRASEEHTALRSENDAKSVEILELKMKMAEREQQIVELHEERDTNDARLQSVKDVQKAFESVRRDCQDKEGKLKDLENVLGQLCKEREQMTSLMNDLREEAHRKNDELEKLKSEYDSFQVNAKREYDDMYKGFMDKLNDVDFPGKQDNISVLSRDGCPIDLAIVHQQLGSSVGHGNCSSGSGDELQQYKIELISASAARTIEAQRSEYEIEVARSAKLQQENDRLVAERERLRTELHVEMQNGSLSSYTCVLLARNGSESPDEIEQFRHTVQCLKDELQRTVEERDVAEAKLIALRDNVDSFTTKNFDICLRLDAYETEIKKLQIIRKEYDKKRIEYMILSNRNEALIYQKEYLSREILAMRRRFQESLKWSLSLAGDRNGDISGSCLSLLPRKSKRFVVAVLVVIATNRMKKMSEKMLKVKRRYCSNGISAF